MDFVKRFPINASGRDFAVGDIHGHFSRLTEALIAIGFDKSRDRLFSVGDLVDRGPESAMALEWLDKPWFHAVRGNHEDMAIRWPNGHMDAANYAQNGGAWNIANTPAERVAVSDALGRLPIAIEVETVAGIVGVVHAACPFPSWSDFTWALGAEGAECISNSTRKEIFEAAMWSRERITARDLTLVDGCRAVVVGHTPLTSPQILGNVFYIDTAGWTRFGTFTFLRLDTLEPAVPASPRLDWEA
ncbi:serine/threonine protein phosphatase [Paraburkholderia tropica]|nr:serine/threonine protein phosphatase [Paraburkholderia tropica]